MQNILGIGNIVSGSRNNTQYDQVATSFKTGFGNPRHHR